MDPIVAPATAADFELSEEAETAPLELAEAAQIAAALDTIAPLIDEAVEPVTTREESSDFALPSGDARAGEPDQQTAALLEEARQRLGPPPEPEPEPVDAVYGPELFSRTETDADVDAEPPPVSRCEGWSSLRSETIDAPWRSLELDVVEDDPPQGFAPISESPDEALFSPATAKAAEPELSTREVIDRARAAARAANGAGSVDVHAKVESRAASGRLFQGFGGRSARRERGNGLQTALVIAGGAAFLSVGAAGLMLMESPSKAPAIDVASFGESPRAALALSPRVSDSSGLDGPLGSAPVYAKVRSDVESGVPGAIGKLKALAASDHPQAQLFLAQLYDLGEAGLQRNPVEARRLISLAAESGEPQAMHNLGVYFFRGEGGAQDLASAAQWFRKAASAGVVESQYNLGLMYQAGSGVTQDNVQARRWFAQAAAKGDAEAKRALADLAPKPATTSPRAAAPAKPTASASQNVRQSQLILARLGYYDGPTDGYANPAYRSALLVYQGDQNSGGPRPYVAQR